MKSVKGLLDYNIVRDNIEEILIQSTLDEYKEGLHWYSVAHSFCKELGEKYNIPTMNVCGIVSALSPQKGWEHNKEIADLYFQGIYKHTKVQINKCHNILKAKSFIEVSSILKGLKTRNFFGSLMYPKDSHYVCIDRHIIKTCFGVYNHTITDYQYKKLKDIFKIVSSDLGFCPSDLQSVLWILYKNRKIKYVKQ